MSKYITVKEAAEIARVTERTIRNWVAKGAITAQRVAGGRKLLLLRSEFVQE